MSSVESLSDKIELITSSINLSKVKDLELVKIFLLSFEKDYVEFLKDVVELKSKIDEIVSKYYVQELVKTLSKVEKDLIKFIKSCKSVNEVVQYLRQLNIDHDVLITLLRRLRDRNLVYFDFRLRSNDVDVVICLRFDVNYVLNT